MDNFEFVLIFTLIIPVYSLHCPESNYKISIIVDEILKEDVPSDLDIEQYSYLWHVAIMKQDEDSLQFLCSGTTIQDRFVLTAAECVAGVLPSQLLVVAGMTAVRNSSSALENPQSVHHVVRKYQPYYSDGASNLVVLSLRGKVSHSARLQLTNETILSKHCFTLGWGVPLLDSENKLESVKHKENSLTTFFFQPKSREDPQFLSGILDVRNRLGLNSMFMFVVGKMFNMQVVNEGRELEMLKYTKEETCETKDYARLKITKVTATKYSSICSEPYHLCVSGRNTSDLTTLVDIGSPVFCSIKKRKAQNSSLRTESEETVEYGLAGIISQKKAVNTTLSKKHNPTSIIMADSITHISDFILKILKKENLTPS